MRMLDSSELFTPAPAVGWPTVSSAGHACATFADFHAAVRGAVVARELVQRESRRRRQDRSETRVTEHDLARRRGVRGGPGALRRGWAIVCARDGRAAGASHQHGCQQKWDSLHGVASQCRVEVSEGRSWGGLDQLRRRRSLQPSPPAAVTAAARPPARVASIVPLTIRRGMRVTDPIPNKTYWTFAPPSVKLRRACLPSSSRLAGRCSSRSRSPSAEPPREPTAHRRR